jgi:hypothetical protein
VCLWYWSKWLLASAGESRGIGCVHRTKGQTMVFACVGRGWGRVSGSSKTGTHFQLQSLVPP